MTPGCVTTHRFAASISMIRSMAVNAIVSAPSSPGRATRQARIPRRAARSGRRIRRRPGRARRPGRSRSAAPRHPADRPAGRRSRRADSVSRSIASARRRRPATGADGVEKRFGDDASGHGGQCRRDHRPGADGPARVAMPRCPRLPRSLAASRSPWRPRRSRAWPALAPGAARPARDHAADRRDHVRHERPSSRARVDRTSLHLRATYASTLALRYGTRAFSVHSPPRSRTRRAARSTASSSTHRGPPRRHDAALVEVDGVARHGARSGPDHHRAARAASCRPGRPSVRVKYRATLRILARRARTGCSRGSTASSTPIAGCPWVSRDTPFDRPNHGDPFVTPISPLGEAPAS